MTHPEEEQEDFGPLKEHRKHDSSSPPTRYENPRGNKHARSPTHLLQSYTLPEAHSLHTQHLQLKIRSVYLLIKKEKRDYRSDAQMNRKIDRLCGKEN